MRKSFLSAALQALAASAINQDLRKPGTNPNNCSTCDHKRHPDGGWCYMFRDEPASICMQHTGRKLSFFPPLTPAELAKQPEPPAKGEE